MDFLGHFQDGDVAGALVGFAVAIVAGVVGELRDVTFLCVGLVVVGEIETTEQGVELGGVVVGGAVGSWI
jgi:hypothetical protein